MQDIRRNDHVIGTGLDRLRCERLLDVEQRAAQIRMRRGEMIFRVHQESPRNVGITILGNVFTVAIEQTQQRYAGATRTGADLQHT